MNRKLQNIQSLLRDSRLLTTVDVFRFLHSFLRGYKRNRAFCRTHPEMNMPPAMLAFDAYGTVNWPYYYESGTAYAQKLAQLFQKYRSIRNASILEWGCGPARIIRHIPSVFPSCTVYGTDYNEETIRWCSQNVPAIAFSCNQLKPPLSYPANSFDFIYVHSVFTHLSENNGRLWFQELTRVLKGNGLLFFTTNGSRASTYLLPDEKARYDEHGFVERKKIKEGRKMFGAWHSPDYVKHQFLTDHELLDRIDDGTWPSIANQDAWLVYKKTMA